MEKNVIAVDIDSTLHEYMHTVALVALNEFEIRLEDPPMDWAGALGNLPRPEQVEIFQRCHDREYIFLTNPYPYAAKALNRIDKQGYEIWYVSDRKLSAHDDTVEWLSKHGFPQVDNVFCSNDKRGLFEEHSDKLLTVIDDRPRTLVYARYELGLPNVYSIKHTYNQNLTDIPGIHILDDWWLIVDKFEEDHV